MRWSWWDSVGRARNDLCGDLRVKQYVTRCASGDDVYHARPPHEFLSIWPDAHNQTCPHCIAIVSFTCCQKNSLPNIFSPQIWLLALQALHQRHTTRVVDQVKFNSLLAHPLFGAHECAMLANDNARNFKQNGGAGTHGTRTQCADQRQLAPITTSTRVANATDLRVRGWITRLHAHVVATCHHTRFIIKQCTGDKI